MSFQRPTLSDLVVRIEADFVSRLSLIGAVLRRAVVKVLSRVIAGATHMLYGYLDFLSRQLFPDLSELEFLLRQGSLFGLAKTPAGFAKGTATITGTNTTPIPAGTVLLRSDGVEYTVDADVTITAGTATPSLTAVDAGADETLTAGVVLSFESPIAGADSGVTVVASTQDGSDEETDEEFRVRVLARMGNPPHGGNSPDLVEIAKEVPGVTRAWVTPLGLGPGTVIVRCVRDDDVDPIPDVDEVATIQAKFDEEAPAHMTVTVVAPTTVADNMTLSIIPSTLEMGVRVKAELADLYLRKSEPGATILLSAIRTAIGDAGVTDYTLTSPVADVTHAANELPILGTVTIV